VVLTQVRYASPTRPVRWAVRHSLARRYFSYAAKKGSLYARIVTEPALRADPFAIYEQIREHGPSSSGRVAGIFVDHPDVSAILRNESFGVGFGSLKLTWLGRRLFGLSHTKRIVGPADPPSMLVVDPPDHTRYRKLVSGVFTPRAIEALRPRIEEIAEELLDRMAAQTRGGSPIDLAAGYASLLPVTVIGEILGVPPAMRNTLLEWGTEGAPSLDIGLSYPEFARVDRALLQSNRWIRRHLAQLRRGDGDDLTSRLVRQADEQGLEEHELVAIAGLVLGAGFETTVNLLGNGTFQLLRHPDQLALVREDPGLWANTVEEVLRFDSPVQVTGRLAQESAEVNGFPVRAGSLMLLILGAANRDPTVFPEPDRFDVRRENAREHLAFSSGIHFCLGAALARMEGQIGLRMLFDRFPDLELAGTPSYRGTRVLRGYATMPVAAGRVAAAR
jgi:cytochrome P450